MLLEVKNLSVDFAVGKQTLRAVNKVSFSLGEKDSLGLVGESGCGKSTTAFALMQLLARNGKISEGQILLDGTDLASASYDYIRKVRWKDIAIIFQNAMTALNPVQKIGNQLINALQEHENVSRKEAIERAEYLFERVGYCQVPLRQYPHEFSGAGSSAPSSPWLLSAAQVLIADEPTTALDVVAQRQVIELLAGLQDEFNISIIMISHDISAVAEACSHIAVMYGGEIMEMGKSRDVLIQNNHPYTHALVGSFPSLHKPLSTLMQIPGGAPNLANMPVGCPFSPRCPYATDLCREKKPDMRQVRLGKLCKCHYAEELDFNQKEG